MKWFPYLYLILSFPIVLYPLFEDFFKKSIRIQTIRSVVILAITLLLFGSLYNQQAIDRQSTKDADSLKVYKDLMKDISINTGKSLGNEDYIINQNIKESEKLTVKTQTLLDSLGRTGKQLTLASKDVINLTSENAKQILGYGPPTLLVSVYPDSLISLYVYNNSNYTLYDLNINFPNPDPYPAVQRMAKNGKISSWDEMRKDWIFIPPITLPMKSSKVFYEFKLSENLKQTVVFLNLTSRNGSFSGKIVLRRYKDSFRYYSQVSDSKHHLLNEVNHELKDILEAEFKVNF